MPEVLEDVVERMRRKIRGELSYLAPLGSENISAPYFKQCFFRRGGVLPPRQSNTTPPSPKTEITNILFHILNFASIIKFNILKPNDIYICRTAALTSRRYILNFYSTNIHTEYFKHAA